mmetsp:Transcript_30923/g.51202  ORF Transcript_30923/g.51202 Transcript_30923/m.51202 type:complete len:418 (+) Transcript_30923:49-1302(+)
MPLDLVVFGASGFTGQLVCSYLRRHAPSGLRWALAGRDAAKLTHVAETLPDVAGGAAPQEIIAGCDAGSAANKICTDVHPHVVLSTAGPFAKYSDALVHACARAGISYVDINGEIPWVKRVCKRDDEAARCSGALIVPNCGFDSVPSDLGVLCATQALARLSSSPCINVSAYMHMVGIMSGGTIETGLVTEDLFPGEMRDPFLLGGGDSLNRGLANSCDHDPTEPRYEATIQRWVAPFGMAKINTRVVRRSAGVLGAYPNVDIRRFCYQEMSLAPGGAAAAAKMAKNAAISPEKLRELRDRGRLPQPGAGPSAEKRAASSFTAVLVAEAADVTRTAYAISGGDPGYDETAKMVSEAALALLMDRAMMPSAGRGGALTPAAAFGDVLVKRLKTAGMCFEDDFDLSTLPGEPDPNAPLM